MKILAVDTSAGPASCALWEDGKVLASTYLNTPVTHSQTLMPMIETMLKHTGLTLAGVDTLAVSAGPGSFTGVRIGVAAVKGLAFPHATPCVGVSTLAAMARSVDGIPYEGVVTAVMDARCRQVYTASFLCSGGSISRLTPDEAISLEDWVKNTVSYKKSVLCVGDGAQLCYNYAKEIVPELYLAPAHIQYQNAACVAEEAFVQIQSGNTVAPEALRPLYLRLPQAERELKQKLKTEVHHS